MTTRLTSLRVDRIAMVDQGADQDAHMVLFKRHEEGDEGSSATQKRDGKHVSKEEELTDLNLEALPEALREHFQNTELAQSVVDAIGASLTVATSTVPDDTKTELDEANKKLEAATKALADAEPPKTEEEELTKGMSEEVSKAFEAMRKQNADLQKSHDEEVEKREIRDYVETAKGYKNIPGADPEAVGPILYRMAKGKPTEDDVTKFSELLAAAHNTARANDLLKQELGRSGEVSATGGEDAIEKMALAVKTAEPTLTDAQAYDKAIQSPEGKVAYAEIQRERQQNGGAVLD